MEGYSQRQAAKLSGVAQAKLSRLKAKGVIVPDLDGDKYSAELVEKIRLEYGKNTGVDSNEIFPVTDIPIVDDTATSAQVAIQATIDAVDDQTPADVQNTVKIDDSASIDTREDFAEASPTLVEENPAPVTIDVEAEFVTLDQRADKIRKLAADVQRGIIEIGKELISAKAEIGHGNWTGWLKENFDWTDRTAQNFMRVAERFGKTENVFGFKPSTLIQMLALPVGSEEEFIAQQAEEDKPVNEMSARDVKNAVKEFNRQRNVLQSENFGLAQSTAPETNDNTSVVITTETNSPAEADDSAVDTSQKKTPPRGTASGKHYEAWHTPKEIIDAARRVLGEIDLDPASNPKANEVIGAKVFYTKDEDGLSRKWFGRIWLNPPYSNKPPFENSVIQRFANKLAESNFEAAIVLVNNSTETQFFQTFAQFSDAICFTDHRVNFLHGETDKAGRSGCGSAIFYYGRDVEKFCDEFSAFGWLAEFKRPSRKKNTPVDGGQKGL